MVFHMIKYYYWIGSFLIHSLLEEKETLKLVSVVFRHGDRTPIVPVEQYPNDPYKDYTYGNQNHSVLTESGKWRAYKLGEFLKNNYRTFLDSTPESVEARCTDVNRTKESLNFVLKALYPNFVIPKITNPIFNDSLLLPQMCKKFIIDYLKLSKSPNVMKEIIELDDFMKNLSLLTGKTIRTFSDIHLIYTTLENEKFLNFTLPSWTEDLFPDGNILKGAALQYKLLNYNENLKEQSGGILIRKFIDDMLSVKYGTMKKKLFLYSAHDITVVAVLQALGVYFPHVPKFSSAVILELHEIIGNYFVKVVHYLGVPGEKVELKIPNCKIMCPLDKFTRLMKNVLPPKVNLSCSEYKMRQDDEIYTKDLLKIRKIFKLALT
ncbi:venom acid phosphatase Acph-1-like [Leptopilina boulardi]|uniref:venom acid phosphatase Acph-1-like n=1 Tax=Leptopilina boulardi TaxID=63433 RepID=UPI0021F5F482|nr:venom acid phosphatase Acph-1-like [Leptopilina boulardi]